MMKVIYRLSLLAAAIGYLLAAGGCSTPDVTGGAGVDVFVAPDQGTVQKVAVLPFKAATELIGSSISDLVVNDLLRSGRYEVLERNQLSGVLGEAELALSGLSDSKAAELGAMVGADGMIVGTVDEYGSVAYRGHAYPTIGISARLIDSKSGKVLWSVSMAGRAQSKGITLPQHSRSLVRDMMSELYRNLR